MNQLAAHSIFSESIYKVKEPLHVILNKSWDSISEDEKRLLIKILASINKNIAAVRIIQSDHYQTSNLANSTAILFGAKTLPAIEPYTLVQLDSNQLIQADALCELDDQKKKTLWGALKKLAF